MESALKRSDVIGKVVRRILLRRQGSADGFEYVEAIVELEDGTAFCVNESGVDDLSPLLRFAGSTENLEVASKGFEKVLGQTITHVAISEAMPTLVVLLGDKVLLGSDCGPPFNSFAPCVTALGELVDSGELVDFWDRDMLAQS